MQSSRLLFSIGLAVLSLALATPLRAQPAPSLPPGEGRDVVASVCTGCHTLNTIVQNLTTNFGPNSPPAAGAPPPIVASLPAGPGKDLVESRCVTCHDLTRIVASRRPKSDWDGIVANMVNRGATAAPDERQTIVSYLATQFGE